MRKQEIQQSVLEKALERINTLYDRFDKIVVSFSGGKDSTVCLNLALQVARERGKLPLDVYTFDEEALHPETVEYLERVATNPEVRFRWYCIPVQHRNACSKKDPWWYPWDPNKKHLWVRPLPKGAITTLKGFKWGMTMPDCVPLVMGPEHGMVADIRGIRAQESMRRYRVVTAKIKDNWLTAARNGYNVSASPIYDWTTEDVWLAPKLFGWDYNRTYDVFDKAGTSKHQQRVCPPYGEEPLGGLHQYAVCWPDLWDKMIRRVPGATTAARYAKTELYGWGDVEPPEGKTWQSWFHDQMDLWPPKERAEMMRSISAAIRGHVKKTGGRPIPDVIPDPFSGVSWKYFCKIALRGDLKGRKIEALVEQANRGAKMRGLTTEQALRGEI